MVITNMAASSLLFRNWVELIKSYNDYPARTEWWGDRILDAYNGEHRTFYNINYLGEALTNSWDLTYRNEDMRDVEFAIYFHKVAWDPRRDDNLEHSAQWTVKCLIGLEYPNAFVDNILRLMRCAYTMQSTTRQEAILVDALKYYYTLPRFEYRQAIIDIRKEYWWMNYSEYKEFRTDYLNRLLNLSKDFFATSAASHKESAAIANINWELAQHKNNMLSDFDIYAGTK